MDKIVKDRLKQIDIKINARINESKTIITWIDVASGR